MTVSSSPSQQGLGPRTAATDRRGHTVYIVRGASSGEATASELAVVRAARRDDDTSVETAWV